MATARSARPTGNDTTIATTSATGTTSIAQPWTTSQTSRHAQSHMNASWCHSPIRQRRRRMRTRRTE